LKRLKEYIVDLIALYLFNFVYSPIGIKQKQKTHYGVSIKYQNIYTHLLLHIYYINRKQYQNKNKHINVI
jgi:hypothetical protein